MMDHITYPTSAADQHNDRPHLSLPPLLGAGGGMPDRNQESLEPSTIIIPFQRATVLLVDADGNERQERVWIPAMPYEDILRERFAQHGLEVVGIDEIPGETRNIAMTI